MKKIALVSALVLVSVACGQKEEERGDVATITSSSLQDKTVQGEVASSLASEALSAAAAGETNPVSASLAGGTDVDNSTFTRTCEVQSDGSAKVTLASTIDKSFIKENNNRSMSVTLTGKGTTTRLWSKERATLECKNGHFSFEGGGLQAGLKLQLETERERQHKRVFKNARGKEMSWSKSFSFKAARTVEWLEVDDSGSELERQKKISNSDATRSMKIENSKGKNLETKLTVKIGEAGLLVTVKRNKTTKKLISKLIESGDVVATLKDGAEITTSYNNLLFTVDEGKCTMVSGSFTMSIKDKDGNAAASVTCKGDAEVSEEGKLQCTDAESATIEVDAPLCDPEDAA